MAGSDFDGSHSEIPVIDFRPFLDGSDAERETTAGRIKQAFRSVGFVYLTNHGVPHEKVDQCFEWSKRFFNLPLETKMLAPHPPGGSHHRGYSGLGIEKVSQNVFDREAIAELRKAPDVKESYESGNINDEYQPNIWLPENKLPGFREYVSHSAALQIAIFRDSARADGVAFFMESFFTDCSTLVCHVLSAIALGFSLPSTHFCHSHSRDLYQLRLLHYPAVPENLLLSGEKGRLGAHSDFGTLTLLFQDDVGGLEIEDQQRPGIFQSVKPVKGAVLVNVADCLMRWTNDELKSAVHRVKAPPIELRDSGNKVDADRVTKARYSIPFFAGANPDAVVEALPGTWSETKPKKYEPITAGEYILKRMEAIY
ncbi:MAG: hypothetical protein M1820_005755 [Bogoriella megaspora]|nr:MAG: hypothetical protein M1820_005755 [Bogoriella megaspora]